MLLRFGLGRIAEVLCGLLANHISVDGICDRADTICSVTTHTLLSIKLCNDPLPKQTLDNALDGYSYRMGPARLPDANCCTKGFSLLSKSALGPSQTTWPCQAHHGPLRVPSQTFADFLIAAP